MIKNNDIKEEICFLYDNNDNFLFQIDSNLKLNDVRIQIKDQKLDGYYVEYQEEGKYCNTTIYISPEGRLNHWPEGFYRLFDEQLDRLLD